MAGVIHWVLGVTLLSTAAAAPKKDPWKPRRGSRQGSQKGVEWPA